MEVQQENNAMEDLIFMRKKNLEELAKEHINLYETNKLLA